MFFAKQYCIQDVYDVARHFSLAYFIDVCKSPSFCSLSPNHLMSYLGDDNLCIDHEAEVFKALREWFRANPHHEDKVAEILRACVRLTGCPKSYAIAKKA